MTIAERDEKKYYIRVGENLYIVHSSLLSSVRIVRGGSLGYNLWQTNNSPSTQAAKFSRPEAIKVLNLCKGKVLTRYYNREIKLLIENGEIIPV